MNIDLNSLRRKCDNLDDLLISESDIKFNEMLGEGMYMCVCTLQKCV